MPFIVDPSAWDRDRTLRQLRILREELADWAASLDERERSAANPWAIRQARALMDRVAGLAGAVSDEEGLPDAALRAAVEALYETQNTVPYLLRMGNAPPPPFPNRSRPAPEP